MSERPPFIPPLGAPDLTDEATVLVVVHAGSLWSSARGQVPYGYLQGARDLLERDIRVARNLVVVDGFLSDAIPHSIEALIERRLDELEAEGRIAQRLWGCDSGEEPYGTWTGRAPDGCAVFGHQTDAAAHLALASLQACPRIVVTGAWATEDGSSGCATSVAQVLGPQLPLAVVTLSEHALFEEEMFENQMSDDDDLDGEDLDGRDDSLEFRR